MIHIYWGDGKGKTTAAFGLALRAAGRGRRAVIAQFLKTEDSGERNSMKAVPQVELLPLPERMKFVFQMTEEEKLACKSLCRGLLRELGKRAERNCLLVLDEVLGAVETGLLTEDEVLLLLEELPKDCEAVLTGRKVPESIWEKGDYITEMRLHRHPYEKGIPARKGIEY